MRTQRRSGSGVFEGQEMKVMIRKLISLMSVVVLMAALPFAIASDDKKEGGKDSGAEAKSEEGGKADKFSAKCPVSGEDASKEQAAAYREKEVYFCCGDCKSAFEKDNKKFATKANHQLVQTKQFVQAKCPLSGGDLNKDQSIKVNGVKVAFCCDKCKGSMEEASKDDQLTKIFADEVFAKSFEAKKKEDKGGKEEKKAGKPKKSAGEAGENVES
jgi:YHS domain-containing protein